MAHQVVFQVAGAMLALFCLAGCAASPGEDAQNAPPLLNAQSLVGATPAVLSAAFGQPVLRRVDGSAQVWLYHSSVCGLDLILYPDSSGTPRVATAVPDNGNPASCMQSLQHSGITTAAAGLPATL